MPPRKLKQLPMKQDSEARLVAKNTSSSVKGKNLKGSSASLDVVEPEIDIQSAIEGMIQESNEKIAESMQARQENLFQIITRTDAIMSMPQKVQRK